MDLLRHRRATQEELNEGMRQMREAQDRFSRERAEEAIEDQQNPANQGQEIFEEPQSPKNESRRVEETAIEDQKVPAVEDVSKEAVEESLKGSVQKSPNPAVAPTTPAVRSGASGKGKEREVKAKKFCKRLKLFQMEELGMKVTLRPTGLAGQI